MTSTIWPEGLVPALVTPLSNDRFDAETFVALIELHIRSGSAGVVVGGGTGEFGALTLSERCELVNTAVTAARGRIPVIAQTGTLTTRDTITLSAAAQDAGADALLIASPFGEPISWSERVRFYERVTSEIAMPTMIYNTPPAGLMKLAQIKQLGEIPNVTAVKDSSGDPQLMGDLVAWSQDRDFGVYIGSDSLLYDAIAAGVRGVVFGVGSFLPTLLTHVIDLWRTQPGSPDSIAAWRLLRPFLRFMEDSTNYVALCKMAHNLEGLDVGQVREPYLMPEQSESDDLARHLDTLRSELGAPSASQVPHE
jgi:4-hydroxy-tetrahydrodipicolinate synthase